jgi:myo-inositol-1(or 4)-monophosphatase
MNILKQTAVRAATEAGRILLQDFGKKHKAKMKDPTDIVTEVDKKSQKKIMQIIKKRFPDHAIMSEELEHIEGKSDYLWIIDPLDGTANYNGKVPFFCVSIALAYREQVILGVVYDPLHREMFVCQKGKGAYLNGKRIRVSREKNLHRAMIGADSGHVNRSRSVRKMAKLIDHVRGIRWLGAAALVLCYVACGRLKGYMTSNTTTWDCAAGALMVTESGGKVTDINGKNIRFKISSIFASNRLVHNKVLNKIK